MRFAKALLGFCLALQGCLLPEINMRPEVEIEPVAEPLVRGKRYEFTAKVRDGAGEGFSFQWGRRPGACAASVDESAFVASSSPSSTWAYTPAHEHMGPQCIWVRATDEQGARADASITVNVQNQLPVAHVERVPPSTSPVALGSEVRVKITSSDADANDAVTQTFTLEPPNGEMPLLDGEAASLKPCAGAGGNLCFRATGPGLWKVHVVARDQLEGLSPPAILEVIVQEDQPPCAFGTPSAVQVPDPTKEVVLEVRVADDLDSLPSVGRSVSRAKVSWSVWEESTGWLKAADKVQRSFRIPANTFPRAHIVRVRAEVSDRLPRTFLAGCIDSDECPPSPLCTRRLTWTLEFR